VSWRRAHSRDVFVPYRSKESYHFLNLRVHDVLYEQLSLYTLLYSSDPVSFCVRAAGRAAVRGAALRLFLVSAAPEPEEAAALSELPGEPEPVEHQPEEQQETEQDEDDEEEEEEEPATTEPRSSYLYEWGSFRELWSLLLAKGHHRLSAYVISFIPSTDLTT